MFGVSLGPEAPVIASDPAIQNRLCGILFLIRKGAIPFGGYAATRAALARRSIPRLRYFFFAVSESFFHTSNSRPRWLEIQELPFGNKGQRGNGQRTTGKIVPFRKAIYIKSVPAP